MLLVEFEDGKAGGGSSEGSQGVRKDAGDASRDDSSRFMRDAPPVSFRGGECERGSELPRMGSLGGALVTSLSALSSDMISPSLPNDGVPRSRDTTAAAVVVAVGPRSAKRRRLAKLESSPSSRRSERKVVVEPS